MKKIQLFFAYLVVGVFFLITLITVFIPFLILSFLGLKKAGNFWARIHGQFLCRLVLFMLNVKVTDYSKEKYDLKGKKVCFIGNHTSILDIIAMGAPLKLWCGFIVKDELRKVPIINIWTWMLNCTFIKRSDVRASAKAIKTGIEKIKNGWPMAIFPEGTRSKTGKIGEFKAGSFKLATRSDALIVPIAFRGLRDGFEDRKKGFIRVNGGVMIGSPINTTGMGFEEKADISKKVELIIHEMYDSLPV